MRKKKGPRVGVKRTPRLLCYETRVMLDQWLPFFSTWTFWNCQDSSSFFRCSFQKSCEKLYRNVALFRDSSGVLRSRVGGGIICAPLIVFTRASSYFIHGIVNDKAAAGFVTPTPTFHPLSFYFFSHATTPKQERTRWMYYSWFIPQFPFFRVFHPKNPRQVGKKQSLWLKFFRLEIYGRVLDVS